MAAPIISPTSALTFILGGKATVTLVSSASGNRYTYKITKAEKRNPNDADTWFVKLLNGADNYSNYVYIGMIRNNQFAWTGKSRVSQDAPSFVGFNFCFNHLVKGTIVGFEVWHEGKCGRCGRKLTVPESIASGFGPECLGMVGAAALIAASVTAVVAPQRNLNFDGSARQPKAKPIVAGGAPVEYTDIMLDKGGVRMYGKPGHVGDIDAEIRRRITEYKSNAPENYFQDGELDEKQAFNVAYNKFRVQIESESKS